MPTLRPASKTRYFLAAGLLIAMVGTIIWVRSCGSSAHLSTAIPGLIVQADQKTATPDSQGAKAEGSDASEGTVTAVEKEEMEGLGKAQENAAIIEKDDFCRLLEISKDNERMYVILHQYMDGRPFQKPFNEYISVIHSHGLPRSRFGRFYAALRDGGILVHGDDKFSGSPTMGARELLKLAREDDGNAAPAAFALVLSEDALVENNPAGAFSVTEREEALEHLESATYFNAYSMDYLRELGAMDDDSAVGLFIRAHHFASLAVPNWMAFKSKLERATETRPDLRLKLADLIAANAKNAKAPSNHLGYSYLEHSFAQSIAGGSRQYQKQLAIDATFPNSQQTDFNEIAREASKGRSPETPCGDPATNPMNLAIRRYVKELRSANAGLGIAY